MSISYLHNEQCDFAKLLLYSRSSFLHLLLDRGRSLWRKSNILYTHFVGRTYSVNSCWQVVEGVNTVLQVQSLFFGIKITIILQYSPFQLTFTIRFYTFFRCAVSFREANTASVGLSALGTKCVEVIPWQNGQSSLRTFLDCLLYVKVLFAET